MPASKPQKVVKSKPSANIEVVRRSLDLQAADKLREAIMSGEFEPGERLTEEFLAASTGLSRGTLRLTLRQLMHEGLVTQEPSRDMLYRRSVRATLRNSTRSGIHWKALPLDFWRNQLPRQRHLH
ncbi:GntR family transcriptional regulator [Caballeronia sp. 15715]|uniref:GntR family transcriptional regulator n=1 Tax=unclassified Caballeronia TaxID=2646786 RepID=UPI0039E5E843